VEILQQRKCIKLLAVDKLPPRILFTIRGFWQYYDSNRKMCFFKSVVFCVQHDCLWQWFDDISHRWCNYSVDDSATLEKAYQAGDPSVKWVVVF